MSTNKLDETLEELGIGGAETIREQVISESLNNLKGKVSGLDIQIERQKPEVKVEVEKSIYEEDKTALADTARAVYRTNIKPAATRDRKDKIDAVQAKDPADEGQPNTHASRANVKALSRSLAGMRSGSGNDGKISPVGPNGTGNVGKTSPTGANGVGNVGTNGMYGNYYALTTDMTLEEYESYVQDIFEGDCGCDHEKEMEKKKEEIKARGGPPGKKDPSMKKEDVVYELQQRLVTMGSTDWIVVDQILREMAQELDVAPRTLSREFRSVHGIYPDKWIKDNLNVEVCGFMPLEEAARLNKVGKVYEVSFMFRGGTNRLKFFWPMPGEATKEDMQREVEKFWPKARLLTFYPAMDGDMQDNYMVCAPPMTENYHVMEAEDWTCLSEEVTELLDVVYEEEGEPVSPIINEEHGISVFVEDHDTGEERKITITEEGLRDWFGNSKSSDGKKGWVNVVTGDSCASDKPGEGIPKCVSSSKRDSMSESERKASAAKKRREDPGQQSKSGASKPTNVKTDVKEEYLDETKEGQYKVGREQYKKEKEEGRYGGTKPSNERVAKLMQKMKEDVDCPICGEDPCGCIEGNISEEKDKKGEGSGKKDACYSKVKSRYSVWPSAYASGALVKCRQKGAKNWGNSSKKEEVEYKAPTIPKKTAKQRDTDEYLGSLSPERPVKGGKNFTKEENLEELKCWKGYRRKPGSVPGAKGSCVKEDKKEEDRKDAMPKGDVGHDIHKRAVAQYNKQNPSKKVSEGYEDTKRKEVLDAMSKKKGDFKKRYGKDAPDVMYGAAANIAKKKGDTSKSDDRYAYEEVDLGELHDALLEGDEMKGMSQKSGDKRSTDSGAGMTAKGVAKYNRRTGGNLKTAVTTPPSELKPGSKAAGRRKSFCARSRGWDGERGKAARKRWNC